MRNCYYEGGREGTVLTLGELLLALGKEYTAAQIYAFYRTLRIVAVKRWKDHSAHRGDRRATGTTRSEFQASRIKSEQKPNKFQLLEEYAAVNKCSVLSATQRNVDSAIRFLHQQLLRDLWPP